MSRIHVMTVLGSGEGGGTQLALEVVRRLGPARFALTVIAPESAAVAEVCQRAGARYYAAPILRRRVGSAVPRLLRARLLADRPDLVHAHGTRAGWFTYQALTGPLRALPWIYSEHLYSFHKRRGPARAPWLLLERALCRRASLVTTSCAANAKYALAAHWLAAAKLPMTHYGIALDAIRAQAADPVERRALGVPEDALIIGTVARLIAQKGLRYLFAALPQVLSQVPQAHVVVVGDGPLRPALEAQCAALGIAERVHFLGAHAEPWRLLAASDVIALPSLFEGLPLTALEALAAERPVVATDLGGTAEVVIPGRTGLLVPPRDAPALAAALVRLGTQPDERARMRREAAAVVAPYDLP
ncbi:MAG TPA: glycosyltransferase, partial [Ktedonobacterales bacterium]|nr:glycosyltransferase [Ktedonobacterales bacterium]